MGTRHSQASKESFARELVAWRKRRGQARKLKRSISQSEAARELGLSVRTLQNWEIARCRPAGPLLGMLRKILANGQAS